ncbi:MAG: hypothetical protein U1F11_06540 [Steroidobacteraceae bacterium]
MRATEDRYDRDRQRHDLALRFIRHEAAPTRSASGPASPTTTSASCTAPTYARAKAQASRATAASRRGACLHFLRSREAQQEACGLASILSLSGVLPTAPVLEASRHLPGVARNGLLCDAFETWRRTGAGGHISFEHAVFLCVALAGGHEIRLQRCRQCDALGIAEP